MNMPCPGPPPDHLVNVVADHLAGDTAIAAAHHQFIVACLPVANVGNHGQVHGLVVKLLGCSASANAAAVLATGMHCDLPLAPRRASRIELSHPGGELPDVRIIQLRATPGSPGAPCLPRFGVCRALLFGSGQSPFLDQQTLPFIAFSGSTPPEDDRGQSGVRAGTPCEGSVAGGEKRQMIKVGTTEARGPSVRTQKRDPRPSAEFAAALVASRFSAGNEHQ